MCYNDVGVKCKAEVKDCRNSLPTGQGTLYPDASGVRCRRD